LRRLLISVLGIGGELNTFCMAASNTSRSMTVLRTSFEMSVVYRLGIWIQSSAKTDVAHSLAMGSRLCSEIYRIILTVFEYTSGMEESQRKEQFSRAYAHAVASIAGFGFTIPSVDRESVDVQFSGDSCGDLRAPRLEAQTKCTASLDVVGSNEISFALKLKNYDDLRNPAVILPKILIVVCVPNDIDRWGNFQLQYKTVLKHSAYWLSLKDYPKRDNDYSVTVHLPRVNTFTPASLTEIMTRIARGESL